MRTAFRTLVLMLIAALTVTLVSAEDDASAVVRRLYAIQDAKTPEWSRDLWSTRMLNGFDREAKRTTKAGMGALDFDFRSNSQDPAINDLRVGPPSTTAKGMSVRVAFKNGPTPNELVYDLVREKGRWLIDDVRSLTGERWRLSKILSVK